MKRLQKNIHCVILLAETVVYLGLIIFFVWAIKYLFYDFLIDVSSAIGDIPDKEANLLFSKWHPDLHTEYLVLAILGINVAYLIGFIWIVQQLVVSYKQLVTILKDND